MSELSDQIPLVPTHVAIVMDGNGRWARKRHLPRTAGHKRGVDATRRAVEYCARHGVKVLTVFAFSSENWKRPASEVGALMQLFITALSRELDRLADNGIRLRFIGERTEFPAELQERIEQAEARTRGLTGMQLVIAANYGGRWDIARAARQLAEEAKYGRLSADEIDAEKLDERLATAGLPDPDLFIRTGGERRISNFLLWQLAYAELYFTDVLWPDFDESELDAAFAWYAGRERRFGSTSEQLKASSDA